MPYTYEAHESPSYSDDGSLERVFFVNECQDGAQAEGLVMAAAFPTYEGRIREARPAVNRLGFNTFRGTIKYKPPPLDDDQQSQTPNTDPPGGILEFDTSGGTQHVTTALAQTNYPANAPDMKRAIGVGTDTVDGTDVIVPKLSLTITRHWQIAQVTGAYVKNLARLTGKTNGLEYALSGELFDVGELLFLGATGTCRGRPDWEITYRFEASQNGLIDVSPTLTQIPKQGHQYLWVKFKHEANANHLVQVPEFAYVATVYYPADFRAFLGF